MGVQGFPTDNYPLGECAGECEHDSDCAGDLTCFQRKDGEPVPGCTGLGKTSGRYCINDLAEIIISTDAPVAAPTPVADYSLGACETGCVTDIQCTVR